MRPQPIPGELTLAIGEFRQIGFTGEITLAGNAGDEAIGGLQPVTSPGEFVAQMLRAIGPGILLTVANEADVRRLDKLINSSISAFVCGSNPNAIAAVRRRIKMDAKTWRRLSM